MDGGTAGPDSEVFVLRFWRIRNSDGGWRGQVEHVPSGRRVPLREAGQFWALLQQHFAGAEVRDED